MMNTGNRVPKRNSSAVSWRSRLARVPLWMWLGIFAIVIYLIPSAYQADIPAQEVAYFRYDSWLLTPTSAASVTSTTPLSVTTAYPQSLGLDGTTATWKPVYVWLSPSTVESSPFTVTLSSSDGSLLLVDKEGHAVNPSQIVTPTTTGLGAPTTFYVQRLPKLNDQEPISATLSLQVANQAGSLAGSYSSLSIDLPPRWSLRADRFYRILFGPSTQLLLLAAALLTLAKKELDKWQDRKSVVRVELAEIEKLEPLMEQDPGRAAEWIRSYPSEHHEDWKKYPELQNGLDTICYRHFEFNEFFQLTDPAKEEWTEANITSLLEVYRYYGDKVRYKIVQLLTQLLSQLGYVYPISTIFVPDPDGRDLLREPAIRRVIAQIRQSANLDLKIEQAITSIETIFPRPTAWPELWPPLPSDYLLRQDKSLTAFGKPKAEVDFALTRGHYLHPAIESMCGPLPAALFGPPGSGRTAAALILAHLCQTGAEPKTFPIHVSLLPNQGTAELITAAADAILKFLALNPYAFLEANQEAQVAMACLLKMGLHTFSEIERRFRLAGLPISSGFRNDKRTHIPVVSESQLRGRIDRYFDLEQFLSEINGLAPQELTTPLEHTTLPQTLEHARPAGFDYSYVLVDVQTPVEKEVSQLAEQIRVLSARVWPLAQLRVYLKLFIPDKLEAYLKDLTSLNPICLNWTPAELTNLLDSRIRLSDITSQLSVSEPEQWLVNSAQGSPRTLIANGIQLITHHLEQSHEKLVHADFSHVLGNENEP